MVAVGCVVGLPIVAYAAVVLIGGLSGGNRKTQTSRPPSASAPTTTPAAKSKVQPGTRVLSVPAKAVRSSVRVPILMYHRIAPVSTVTNAVSRDLTVTPAAFRAQMAWLAANGYRAITQEQLFRGLYEGAPLPKRPVVFTFDDGYVDGEKSVLPMLVKRKWPATFYVITGRVGQRAFMSWRQLQHLDRAGMDIGSHTVGHRELPGLDSAGKRAQLTDSKRDLERHLHHPVYWFCYPAGRFDTASVQATKDAGYLIAVTTQPGSTVRADRPLETPRIRVRGPGSIDQLRQALGQS